MNGYPMSCVSGSKFGEYLLIVCDGAAHHDAPPGAGMTHEGVDLKLRNNIELAPSALFKLDQRGTSPWPLSD
jgi:hypothetical protein